MNEHIRKHFSTMLDRLSENVNYEERVTKTDTEFSVHTLSAFLTYYALNPHGLNGGNKEYLLSSTELFSLLNSSSISVEEIWNIIDMVNTNFSIKTQHNDDKYLIPSFSIDLDRTSASSTYTFEDWDNVGKLLEDLEKSRKSKVLGSKPKLAVNLNTVFEDIHRMLDLLKKSKIDQTLIENTANETNHSDISLLMKRLCNVLSLECVNVENILIPALKDSNKRFEEQDDSSTESDNDVFSPTANNNLSLDLNEFNEEQKFHSKERRKSNQIVDDEASYKSDEDSENPEKQGVTLDGQEFDSESDGLDDPENDIDYFEDMPGDFSKIKFKDFYRNLDDHPTKDSNIAGIDGEINLDEEDQDFLEPNETEEPKSAFELKEEKKKRKITKLEEELMSSKPWTLQGEVDASQRPFNSLLEEVVEVDLSKRPPPVITRKVTKKLHNIISEIILNKSFDDVQKKLRPVKDVNEFKNQIVLNQEKSKLSLAQIYEKEYLKEVENKNTEEKEETESHGKKEIRELMHSVLTKLQVLSNLHFIPKPALPELRVVSNLSAVAVEEVAPIAASHDKLLAPEEISATSKRPLMDKEERTATDKIRERRKKKLLQRRKAKRVGGNENIGKVRSKNTEELSQNSDLKQLKSSKNFFEHLQQKLEINNKLSKNSKYENNSKGNTLVKKTKRKSDLNSGRVDPKKN